MYYNVTRIAITFLLLFTTGGYSQQAYLDGSFGAGGIVSWEPFQPEAMALQQDGKILLAGGEASPGTSYDFTVYRFNPDGSPDLSFGTGGKAVFAHANYNVLVGIAELPGGQLLGLGTNSTTSDGASGLGNFLFVRINTDGTLDMGFGLGGFAERQLNPAAEVATPRSMKMLAGGKVLVAGSIWYDADAGPLPSMPPYHVIAVFNADLGLDTSFNATGYRSLTVGSTRALDLGSNGTYLTGTSLSGQKVYRMGQDGVATAGFGSNGAAAIAVGDQTSGKRMNSVLSMQDGKIMVSGAARYNGDGMSAFLARLQADGQPDTGFGTLGIAILENVSPQDEMALQSIPLADGRMASGLQFWNADNYDYALWITNQDGTPDSTLGTLGRIVTPMLGDQKMTCMARQPDGKILVAGNDGNAMVMARYDLSGALGSPAVEKQQILLYPNPSSGRVTISGLPDDSTVSLYSISGQKLLDQVIKGSTEINIGDFPDGMYLLVTVNGPAKIIKN